MSKPDDYIYVTGDEPFIQVTSTAGRSALSKVAASAALVASGLAIGFAFNPASAFVQQPVATDGQSQNGATINPSAASPASAGQAASSSAATNTAAISNYQVPSQQLSAGTSLPDFGNLSSATPSGSWSDEDEDVDDDDEDSDDREDHDDRDEDEDDD